MTCLEFQGLMIQYINGELSYKDKESFMEHLSTCDDCKEELEIYYIILTSMKQMDDDMPLSENFHEDFLENLSATEHELLARRRGKRYRRIAFPAVVSTAMLLTGVSVASDTEIPGENIAVAVDSRSESHYEMKFRFNSEERHRMYHPKVTEQKILKLWEKLEHE